MLQTLVRVFFWWLFTILSLVHCSWRKPPPVDTLVVGLESSPKTLDPRFATDANGQRITSLIFSSLVKIGPDLKPVGDLAKTWTYNNKTYYFELHPNVQFHNGRPLSKEDILSTFLEYQKDNSPFKSALSLIKNLSASYDSQNGYWLKIELKTFTATLLTDLSNIKFLPKDIVESQGESFYKNPIGTGVLKFNRQDTNSVHLARFENYFAQKSKSKFVRFKVIKDGNTRFQKTYKGKIDIVQSDLPYSKLAVFERSPRFKVITQPGLSMTYVLLNLRDPILKEKINRYVLFQSMNRKEIIDFTLEGYAETASSILTPSNPFFNKDMVLTKYSQEQVDAARLAMKGKKIVLKTSNSIKAIANGKVIAHHWRKVGLNVQLESYEWGTFYEDIKKGRFQMATMKWVGATEPDIYRVSLHSRMTPPGRNRGYYANSELDRWLEEGLLIETPSLRVEHYKKVQAEVYKDLPTLPLWYETQFAVVHKRVQNYKLPANGDFSSLVHAYKVLKQ